MLSRSLLIYLLPAAFLLSTLGCSKKTDPGVPSQTNIGSYTYNGRSVDCTAAAKFTTGGGQDLLRIELNTKSEANSPEILYLYFSKNTAQPASAYELRQMQQFHNSSLTAACPADAFTLVSTSGGGFSGTFSYESPRLINVPMLDITNGVFTDVRP